MNSEIEIKIVKAMQEAERAVRNFPMTERTLKMVEDMLNNMKILDDNGNYVTFSTNADSKGVVASVKGYTTYYYSLDDGTSHYEYDTIDSINHININFEYYELKPSTLNRTRIVPKSEERLVEYIESNFDKEYIKDCGMYIYQVIQEKAYEIIEEVISILSDDDWFVPDDHDDVIEAVLEEIDFDSIYDLIDEILTYPVTMEQKLAEVGMSESDFL